LETRIKKGDNLITSWQRILPRLAEIEELNFPIKGDLPISIKIGRLN